MAFPFANEMLKNIVQLVVLMTYSNLKKIIFYSVWIKLMQPNP